MNNETWLSFIFLLLLGSFVYTPVAAQDVSEQWDAIAKQYIRPGKIGEVELNVVDYSGINNDPRWKVLLESYETIEEPSDKDEKMAFWINAYNVMAIKVVLSKYPVDSIKDVGGWITSVWDMDAGMVAGKTRSLTEIEHEILRKMGDARIHAAIVCASLSCPPIRPEAFTAAKLDTQLDEQMRTWLANKEVGLRIDDDGETLRVSSIFKWFSEDFEKEAGSVREYLSRYLSEDQKKSLQKDSSISYLSYDWSLNDKKRNKD